MQQTTVCVLSFITFIYVFAVVCAESGDSHSPLDTAALRLANEDSGKRGWNELSGMWGKRDWNNLQGMWGKRGWNNLQNMWGKRGWNNLQNMWGKRGWNNLQGMWGKRDTDTPEVIYIPSDKKSGWTNLNGMWGKRSSLGWRREPSAWERFSIDEEEPEIMKEMLS